MVKINLLIYHIYKINDLPKNLQGVYIQLWDADLKNNRIIHSDLYDNEAIRSATDGQMPIVWWGNIKEDNSGVLYACTYPRFFWTIVQGCYPVAFLFISQLTEVILGS